MKKWYSALALLLFVMAVVARCAMLFVHNTGFLSLLLYLAFGLGLVMIGLESFEKKLYANAFCFDNRFGLSIASYACAGGLLLDFVLNSILIYSGLASFGYNKHLVVAPLGLQCLFGLLSAICFVMLGLSFSKSKSYDVRQLGGFNAVILLFFVSKGLGILSETVQSSNVEKMLYFITVIFGILAFLSYAREIDNADGTRPFSVFAFRGFSFAALLCFLSNFVMVLSGNLPFLSNQFGYSATMLTLGVLSYLFDKNILAHTGAE